MDEGGYALYTEASLVQVQKPLTFSSFSSGCNLRRTNAIARLSQLVKQDFTASQTSFSALISRVDPRSP